MRVGLALSGGGFRAASFHLGVLKRLEELEVLPHVEVLSCVSGGSMIGALYALRCAEKGSGRPGTFPVDALIAEMRPVLTRNLRGRALFGTLGRAWRTARSFISAHTSRIGLMADELDRSLYGGAALSQLPNWVLLNATNLRTGKAWKFFHDRAGDYLAGATDDTLRIRVADAVAASAAYPGLSDPYPFETHWELLRGDLLAEGRWERPPFENPGEVSRWRRRYGRARGLVTFPLVDGGLYDNEGLNGLRSARITHAIISSTTPPEDDMVSALGPRRLLRVVEVMHDRLGAVTRQLAHEMTHAADPAVVGSELRDVSGELRAMAAKVGTGETAHGLELLADRLHAAARVGAPSRGHQFAASAPILLNKTELARNTFRAPALGNLDVPADSRGLDVEIIDELSRVRTDLDALEPEIFDLLVAQGYFLADAYLKVCMRDLLRMTAGVVDVRSDTLRPSWVWAREAVSVANANVRATSTGVAGAGATRGFVDALVGRCTSRAEWWRYLSNVALAAAPAVLILTAVTLCTLIGVIAVGRTLLR